MQITGTLKTVRDIQQISASFQKREFVIETLDQYSQTIQLELHQDKTDIIDAYGICEEVICDINIRGKAWVNPQGEEKVFNTLVCWKIQRSNSTNSPSAETKTSPQEFPQANQSNSFIEDENDTPF